MLTASGWNEKHCFSHLPETQRSPGLTDWRYTTGMSKTDSGRQALHDKLMYLLIPLVTELFMISIIICYIYIAYYIYTFLGTQSALHSKGGISSSTTCVQHPPDDVTAAIVHQNAPHTLGNWWRGDKVMKLISVWGWLGGRDGQRTVGEFGRYTGVTPLLFFEGHPGIFNDHRESGPRFNVSSERRCFLTV